MNVREEVHRQVGADAFLVAQQEHLFQFRQGLAAHGENNVVHHVPFQQHREFARGADRVKRVQSNMRRRFRRFRQETLQADAVVGRGFDAAGQADGALAGAHHHDVPRRRKLAPDHADQPAREKPEKQQANPRIGGEQDQEKTAEFEPEDVFEQNQRDGAVSRLPCRIAQDNPGISRLQFFVYIQPKSDRHPGQKREAKHQRLLSRR